MDYMYFKSKVYEVCEQYPHYVIASFWTLNDAEQFMQDNRNRFALPVIVSRFK
jgi:hypothetical protein